jgi:hypothetical protein
MKLTRRESIAAIGCAVVGIAYQPRREPIAYIVVVDTYDRDLKSAIPNSLDPNRVNRAWHVYWAHHPGAKEKFEKEIQHSRSPWHRNAKEIVVYDYDEFPEPVQQTVSLNCPCEKSLRDFDQFHCFRTYHVSEIIEM